MTIGLFRQLTFSEQLRCQFRDRLIRHFGRDLLWNVEDGRWVDWGYILHEEASREVKRSAVSAHRSFRPDHDVYVLLAEQKLTNKWCNQTTFFHHKFRFPEGINQKPCRIADHQWQLEIREGQISIICVDPCPTEKQVISYTETGGYTTSACLSFTEYTEWIAMDPIPLHVEEWSESGGWEGDGGDYGIQLHVKQACTCSQCVMQKFPAQRTLPYERGTSD